VKPSKSSTTAPPAKAAGTTTTAKPFDDSAEVAAEAAWNLRAALLRAEDAQEEATVLGPVAQRVVADVAGEEPKAERSLMHRFGIAADLVRRHCGALLSRGGGGAGGAPSAEAAGAAQALAAVAVWLRFSSLRLLDWNKNYNVKPREISTALDGLGEALVAAFEAGGPSVRGLALLALAAAGRGGGGDMGQRIRDEILAIQQRSGAKVGV